MVLFLGDSLTAGYGLLAEQAFPALVQERIDAAGLDYRVVNAGVSGDTSAGGRRRIDWLLRQPIAVLVLGLGGNDMLRGHGVDALRANLRAIVEKTRAVRPAVRVVLAGMRAAPNLGREYVEAFEAIFPALARETGAALIPFLLEGVAGDPELNQPDGIHPTAAGQRIVADTVWRTLGPILLLSPPRAHVGRVPAARLGAATVGALPLAIAFRAAALGGLDAVPAAPAAAAPAPPSPVPRSSRHSRNPPWAVWIAQDALTCAPDRGERLAASPARGPAWRGGGRARRGRRGRIRRRAASGA